MKYTIIGTKRMILERDRAELVLELLPNSILTRPSFPFKIILSEKPNGEVIISYEDMDGKPLDINKDPLKEFCIRKIRDNFLEDWVNFRRRW